jgi:carboxyl-terminal processing protease
VEDLRSVLREMLGRLGESHFAIIAREQVDGLEGGSGADEAGVGLDLRWVEGELTVVEVDPGPAADAGIRPGWIVEAIGDQEVAGWKESLAEAEEGAAREGLAVQTVSAATSRLLGPDASTVEVRLRDGSGEVVEHTLARTPIPGLRIQLGNLPPMFADLEHERMALADSGCVGVVRFNVWMLPLVAEYNQAVDELDDCRGMVVDLRGNPGGVGGMVMSTAGSFYDERTDLGVMTTRQGEIRFVAMPRRVTAGGQAREAFQGRLAVLVDELSMSTSEIFAAGLQSTGRARVFGRETPGYALPAHMVRLPNQDVLYHAIADLTDPDGRRIEGQGVPPDVPVELTRADLLDGRDRALEAAVEWAGAAPAAPGADR